MSVRKKHYAPRRLRFYVYRWVVIQLIPIYRWVWDAFRREAMR